MQTFNLYLRIQRADQPSRTIETADIKIFDPINKTQVLKVDNKHDYLKIVERCIKFNTSNILVSKAQNRAEKLKGYKELYKNYNIQDLKNIGITI